jgi:hypothetical protein
LVRFVIVPNAIRISFGHFMFIVIVKSVSY